MKRRAAIPAWCLTIWLASASAGWAQDPVEFFRQNCASCHTIGGGRLTGPDLRNVTERQDRAWLENFIQDPKAVIDSGDAYALKLFQEARGVLMPRVPGMNPDLAKALLDLIEAESKLEESQFKGLQITDRPFTPREIELGREIFLGARKLANGGPACFSCHTMRGLGGLGDGRLGPDLTRVYERLKGRQGLGAWLMAPPTQTMQPLFRKHPLQPDEILPLIAFFEDAAREGGEDTSVAILNFFFLGLGGAILALVCFDAAWRWRLRGVRRPLTEGEIARGA